MGNDNGQTTKSSKNRVVRTGVFHGLEMLAKATEFVMKRSRNSAIEGPPSKRLRRSRRKRKVRFNEQVKIRGIQNRASYTEEERKALWRSAAEIRLHAKRNAVERKWEKKDWRNAVEESGMFFDIKNGVRFHPCWVAERLPHDDGKEMLYGRNQQQGKYGPGLISFAKQYGITAFVDK